MDITIREAVPADAPAIAKVNIESWRSTYRGKIADSFLDEMKFENYEKKWNNILSHTNENICFVAVNDYGDIVGYSVAGKYIEGKFPFEAELHAIYLLKEYQGRGIGKRLFLRAVETWSQKGSGSLVLFVLSTNASSIQFYESFKPDFIARDPVTIGKDQYTHICYGWTDIKRIFIDDQV
jgi:ribosomal protein S18 acetylase RimI-like enzyme